MVPNIRLADPRWLLSRRRSRAPCIQWTWRRSASRHREHFAKDISDQSSQTKLPRSQGLDEKTAMVSTSTKIYDSYVIFVLGNSYISSMIRGEALKNISSHISRRSITL
jgi:hypothetical protein